MNNNEILETLLSDVAARNNYVLKVKNEMELAYNTKDIPLKAIIVYMEKFIKNIGGNDIAIRLITNSINEYFNDDVTLK